ncbi:MAG: hypothetical protein ABF497_05350 [Sporolactobacillus sp.]
MKTLMKDEAIILDWRRAFDEQRKCRIAPVTTASLLTMSPGMMLGFGIVVSVGGIAIIAAHIEKKLAERGDTRAEDIAVWTIAFLMVIGFLGFAWLIIKNPLWGLFQ